jgi:hypothetical protein
VWTILGRQTPHPESESGACATDPCRLRDG